MPSLATLPERKQKYVRARLKGQNKVKAALTAGYTPATANTAGQCVETADVKAVFRSLMQKAAPAKAVVKVLEAGLAATKTDRAQFEGKFTDERKSPDFTQRRAYAQLVAEYAGYVDPNGSAAPGWTQANVFIGVAAPNRAEQPCQAESALPIGSPDAQLALPADVQPAPSPALAQPVIDVTSTPS